jgi:hypothetical protein
MNADEARTRAENFFRKETSAPESSNASLEHEAYMRAIQEKTARLRELRLAKEAAEREKRS